MDCAHCSLLQTKQGINLNYFALFFFFKYRLRLKYFTWNLPQAVTAHLLLQPCSATNSKGFNSGFLLMPTLILAQVLGAKARRKKSSSHQYTLPLTSLLEIYFYSKSLVLVQHIFDSSKKRKN